MVSQLLKVACQKDEANFSQKETCATLISLKEIFFSHLHHFPERFFNTIASKRIFAKKFFYLQFSRWFFCALLLHYARPWSRIPLFLFSFTKVFVSFYGETIKILKIIQWEKIKIKKCRYFQHLKDLKREDYLKNEWISNSNHSFVQIFPTLARNCIKFIA